MTFSPWEIKWQLRCSELDVHRVGNTETIIINDPKNKRCANLRRSSVNYYVVSVCDYSTYIISEYKFPTCNRSVEFLREYFTKKSPG